MCGIVTEISGETQRVISDAEEHLAETCDGGQNVCEAREEREDK